MRLCLDNTGFRRLIPNVIHEVEGETPLFDKLLPWLDTAREWLETNVFGQFQPVGSVYRLAEKIIVYKAFADAVPALDITLSPAGLAVINTEGRAPASKERVERLIASINSIVDANLVTLSIELAKCDSWRETPIGAYYLDTFIPTFENVLGYRHGRDVITTYREVRPIAQRFQTELARYLGNDFLATMRAAYPKFILPGLVEVYTKIQNAALRYIDAHVSDTAITCPNEHEVWHLASPIIAQLNYWPELKGCWLDEMGEDIEVEPFKNKTRGGFFF